MKGKLIVIEGTDCSGKNTQARKLVEKLNAMGKNSSYMSFPRYETPTGKIIAECYLGKTESSWFGEANSVDPKAASLYYAADRLAAKKEIEETLASGKNIICDRYVESNMGHQGGKLKGKAREEMISFLVSLEYNFLNLPKPDAVIFLYVPCEIGMELKKGREGKADGHESSPEHLKNAEECYLELVKKFGWIMLECAPNSQLRTTEDIHNEVMEKTSEILEI